MKELYKIVSNFAVEGVVARIEALGEGFINDTYKVYMSDSDTPKYILQRKNKNVFPDVPAMMENIKKVTDHIRTVVADGERETLTIIPTCDGALCHCDRNGEFWAMCLFIFGACSFERADSPEMAFKGGQGLGLFHQQVAGFNEPLTEIIKGFHNIRYRFNQWDKSVARDAAGRVASAREEISWIESRRDKMLDFWSLYEKGIIPTRTTHNDAKISNFLFSETDGNLLCAIDLDTLMSSTLLNDTGDAIRSYTNTGAEDDPNLDNVSMSLEMFSAYMKGYLPMVKKILAQSEIDYLAFSGIYITYEQVLRFLMDYIDGDTYYKTKYPEHNLVRTRAQYKLLVSMEAQLDQMNNIIREYVAM